MTYRFRAATNALIGMSACAGAEAAHAQPGNDRCEDASVVAWAALPFTSSPTSISSAARLEESTNPCVAMGYTIWYRFLAMEDREVLISTCAAAATGISAVDTVLVLYELNGSDCGDLVPVWCNDDECGFRALLRYEVRAGSTYFVQAGVYRAGTLDLPPASGDDEMVVHIALTPLPDENTWVEAGDAGPLPVSAQVISGGPASLALIAGELSFEGDVDMFALDICDGELFRASTIGRTELDTQLFLFNALGAGVVMNDDEPGGTSLQSLLTFPDPAAAGATFYLAVASYAQEPREVEGLAMWNREPFRAIRPPDGPGQLGQVSSWGGARATRGPYEIEVRGVKPAGQCWCSSCFADFDGNGGVDGGDVEAFFVVWAAGTACGDVDASGGVDGLDVEVFFHAWVSGNC